MIDTIIFDIGNVLTVVDWNKVFRDVGISENNIPIVKKATVESPFWHEYDRGIQSMQEIIQGCIGLAPEYEEDILKLFNNPDKIIEVCDYASDWIKSFRDRGFRTYILSNFPKEPFIANEDKFDFLKFVDGAVVSYRFKEVKPEKPIFDRLARMYDIVPANAIFVDDLTANIEAAKSYGFNGVVFLGKEDADREIEKICQDQQIKN